MGGIEWMLRMGADGSGLGWVGAGGLGWSGWMWKLWKIPWNSKDDGWRGNPLDRSGWIRYLLGIAVGSWVTLEFLDCRGFLGGNQRHWWWMDGYEWIQRLEAVSPGLPERMPAAQVASTVPNRVGWTLAVYSWISMDSGLEWIGNIGQRISLDGLPRQTDSDGYGQWIG